MDTIATATRITRSQTKKENLPENINTSFNRNSQIQNHKTETGNKRKISTKKSPKSKLNTSLNGAVGGSFISSEEDIEFVSCPESDSDKPKSKLKKNMTRKDKKSNPKISDSENPFSILSKEQCSKKGAELLNEIDCDKSQPNINDVWSVVKSLLASIKFVSKQYDDILQKYEKISSEQRTSKNAQNRQHDNIIVLKKEVQQVSIANNDIEQEKLNRNIVLKSLPIINPLQSKKTLVDVATKLKVNLNVNDIKTVQRYANKGKDKYDYVYQLHNIENRNDIFKNRRNTKLIMKPNLEIVEDNEIQGNTRQIGTRVFINEQLTQKNHNLLQKAKGLFNFGFKYIWFKFGKVQARRTDTSKVIHIYSMEMIDDIVLQVMNNKLTPNQPTVHNNTHT